jgi:hypothetical protein
VIMVLDVTTTLGKFNMRRRTVLEVVIDPAQLKVRNRSMLLNNSRNLIFASGYIAVTVVTRASPYNL